MTADLELVIAPLRTGETDAAVALWQEAGLLRPWNDPRSDITRALGGPSSTVLAGRLDDRLVATAMVGHDGHRGWVYYLAVDASCRGRGYGAAMMRAAEDFVRMRGIPKLHLLVRGDNSMTLGFYETIGYARSGVVTMAKVLID